MKGNCLDDLINYLRAVLTSEQIWNGLLLKIRSAETFVPGAIQTTKVISPDLFRGENGCCALWVDRGGEGNVVGWGHFGRIWKDIQTTKVISDSVNPSTGNPVTVREVLFRETQKTVFKSRPFQICSEVRTGVAPCGLIGAVKAMLLVEDILGGLLLKIRSAETFVPGAIQTTKVISDSVNPSTGNPYRAPH
jgi:hypothetical protein